MWNYFALPVQREVNEMTTLLSNGKLCVLHHVLFYMTLNNSHCHKIMFQNINSCVIVHTHTYSQKHLKLIFCKHKFSYTTHFAAYTIEASVTSCSLHRHTKMSQLKMGSRHCTAIQSLQWWYNLLASLLHSKLEY